ncbi:MAG: 50S ribosomal protein L13 [Weeksellaceae bacterium]
MTHLTHTTRSIKAKEINRKWHLVDANGKTLGRISPDISTKLQGKHKVEYVPNIDMGDHIVVINADKVKVTGKKAEQKEYERYSGYPGGLKTLTFNQMMDRNPEEVIRRAVSGMLPKNKLRDPRLARLHVYKGEQHPHKAEFANTEVTEDTKAE